MYSTSALVSSYNTCEKSPRRTSISEMYPSPPSSSARKVSRTFPSASTVYAPAALVETARTAASSPIRPMTSLATPRASTA